MLIFTNLFSNILTYRIFLVMNLTCLLSMNDTTRSLLLYSRTCCRRRMHMRRMTQTLLTHEITFSSIHNLFMFNANLSNRMKTIPWGNNSGVFIVCWLPFFVVNLLTGLCADCIAHEEIVSAVVTWLGWINSSMK